MKKRKCNLNVLDRNLHGIHAIYLNIFADIEKYLLKKYQLTVGLDFHLIDLSCNFDDNFHYILLLKNHVLFIRNQTLANNGILMSGGTGKEYLEKMSHIMQCCGHFIVSIEKEASELFFVLDAIISQNKCKFNLK